MQEQVIVQEIPQVLVVDWTPEQNFEPIEVLPQERVQQHTAIQIVHVPVPQNQEQSAVFGLVNSQFPVTSVEASQTTLNTSSTSTSSSAPVYKRIWQVCDVAHATPAPEIDVPMHNKKPMIDEISSKLDTMIDVLSPLNGLADLALREGDCSSCQRDTVLHWFGLRYSAQIDSGNWQV